MTNLDLNQEAQARGYVSWYALEQDYGRKYTEIFKSDMWYEKQQEEL